MANLTMKDKEQLETEFRKMENLEYYKCIDEYPAEVAADIWASIKFWKKKQENRSISERY